VFDISTFPGSFEFLYGGDRDTVRQFAPKLLAACAYSSKSQRYFRYLPNQVDLLLNMLASADELVTFNGLKFDLVVLERHYGLSPDFALRKSHVDLAKIFEKRIGRWVTFDEVIQLNLGERKKPASDFPHDPVHRTDVLAGCKSDVQQTYKLWKLYKEDQLRFPIP